MNLKEERKKISVAIHYGSAAAIVRQVIFSADTNMISFEEMKQYYKDKGFIEEKTLDGYLQPKTKPKKINWSDPTDEDDKINLRSFIELIKESGLISVSRQGGDKNYAALLHHHFTFHGNSISDSTMRNKKDIPKQVKYDRMHEIVEILIDTLKKLRNRWGVKHRPVSVAEFKKRLAQEKEPS